MHWLRTSTAQGLVAGCVLLAQCLAQEVPPPLPLQYGNASLGEPVKPGTTLRILPVGDSITVGWLGGDGNGYRKKLRDDLSEDKVVFAGTEKSGSMKDPYFAAWTGKTIRYMHDHIDESLDQRPNIILLHAGTNDMNPDPNVSTEGRDPAEAAERLGELIDKMIQKCPDATIVVAMIIGTCREQQAPQTEQYQAVIPGVVQQRTAEGHHVLAADFTGFPPSLLQDCIHPNDDGYHTMGDWWYDFVTQIPADWISTPVGPDPERELDANGGPDPNIPPLDWGTSPVQDSPLSDKLAAAAGAGRGGMLSCNSNPTWYSTGKMASGRGVNGDAKFSSRWIKGNKIMNGTGLDPKYVRLHDMNGDGKADYVWIHPDTGLIRCWINNYPDTWTTGGNDGGILADGRGPSDSVFLADMNGDGLDDYLVVNPDTGAADIYWNYGPESGWAHGWKFVEGGEVASGVPHANWQTLRLADINGDGRADYLTVGVRGSLALWLNQGSLGEDVKWLSQGGITAGGSVADLSQLILADIDGDGRDDYLIWDDTAGLSGYLNVMTQRNGVPRFVEQGGSKSIATGIDDTKNWEDIRIADVNGDGKADYAYIDGDGAVHIWWNDGKADTSRVSDGIRFADIDGDGLDDYVFLGHETGSVTVYLNRGQDQNLGWKFDELNDGDHIASGRGPADQILFGDINGDGLDDYLVLKPENGQMSVWLNDGPDPNFSTGWKFKEIGSIASGLGPGKNVRIADIDGDGYDDYILLHPNGGTKIYWNNWAKGGPGDYFHPMPDADASGINYNPDEIQFVDINGDGKADYVWTRKIDGVAKVWYNNYPNKPVWREGGVFASGVGANGDNVRYGIMQHTGRASYIVLDPTTGALAAWLNGCENFGNPPSAPLPPRALPQSATEEELRFQPAMDFDTDSCYNVPAIDANGKVARGLPHDYTGASSDCRDESDLDNNNVYVRRRCNNGWCVYLYDYYFEKDVGIPKVIDAGGHRHDWEHIAVWVKDGKAEWVCTSAHGKYSKKRTGDLLWDGTHPKIVYHKDGGLTHAFRFATSADDVVENHKGVWFRGALVNYSGFPSGVRDKLFNHDFGKANVAIKNENFASNIDNSKPDSIVFDSSLDG